MACLRKAEFATQALPNFATLSASLYLIFFGRRFNAPFYSNMLDLVTDSRRQRGLNDLAEDADMADQTEIETWAMVRAQQIVMQQGANLVVAAQRLDHKKTTANTYALRAAIVKSLVEALSAPPAEMTGPMQAGQ
jgi:hypothetical protein